MKIFTSKRCHMYPCVPYLEGDLIFNYMPFKVRYLTDQSGQGMPLSQDPRLHRRLRETESNRIDQKYMGYDITSSSKGF
jgi:hypothetical protein